MLRQAIAALVMVLTGMPVVTARQQDYPFKLVRKSEAGAFVILAQNSGPAPVLLKLQLSPAGAIVEPSPSLMVVVKPDSTVEVARVRAERPRQPYRAAMSYTFSLGDPAAVPDPLAQYRLPFSSGQGVKVGQMWGGRLTTHRTPESQYAIDLIVPEGTPVLAARAGTVIDVDQRYTQGGPDPALKANHVLLLHPDGTLGLYSHLAYNGARVQFGQWLEAGQLIGYSGNTGYSFGPHLHFSVLTNAANAERVSGYLSHQVRFEDSKHGTEIVLEPDADL